MQSNAVWEMLRRASHERDLGWGSNVVFSLCQALLEARGESREYFPIHDAPWGEPTHLGVRLTPKEKYYSDVYRTS